MMVKLATQQLTRRKPIACSTLGALVVVLLGAAAPALAQSAPGPASEGRLRRIEAEVRALQRQVFPGSDGKFFTPEVTAGGSSVTLPAGTPASSPVTDLLTRMEAVEGQLARLTALNEETANRVAQLEAKLAAASPARAAMAGPPAPAAGAAAAPAPVVIMAMPAPAPVVAPPPVAALAPKPAASTLPKPVATKPTPQRVAAVQKIEKPQTGNTADDEYSYGYRLWDAKFYPEAAQQLRLYVDKYPRDPKLSYGRNLLGRALLEDGKPRDAGTWFVQNYQADKKGARAADSLLNLAEAMRQLKDTSRACIALAEFGEVYWKESAGRLKAQYGATKSAVKCD